MAPTILRELLLVVGYYAVAFGAIAVWTFRDFAATRRSASPAGADAFLLRLTALLGLAAGVGAYLTLRTFLVPLPALWVLAAVAVADGVLTCLGVQLLVRAWPRLTGKDALGELRGHPEPAAPPVGSYPLGDPMD
jgi:multisubunit Na+/H+ antiporter MnhG subunit